MIYLTDPGKVWAIFVFVSSVVLALTCLSLVELILFQRASDRKSRAFALVMFNMGAFGVMTCIADAVGRFDPPHLIPILVMMGILLAAVPVSTFSFAVEFLDIWTSRRRKIAAFYAFYLAIVTIVILISIFAVPNLLFEKAAYLEDGTFEMTYTPLTVVIVVVGQVSYLYTFVVLFREYRARQTRENRWFFYGLTIVAVAGLSYAIEFAAKYSLGTNLQTLGALMIAGPVLRQRLFDPLAVSNARQVRMTEHLKTITRVGQQATSLLDLDRLLEAVVKEIRLTFDYSLVAIFLTRTNHQDARVMQSTAESPLAYPDRAAPVVESLVPQVTRTESASSVAIPLTMGSTATHDERQIGILEIQSRRSDDFGAEALEVLQILSHQIAIAFRNAQLFAEIQQARRAADDASASKTQFISTMSHEIRMPLQAIIASVDSMHMPELNNGVVLPEAYRKDAATVHKYGRYLMDIVNAVLDLNKMEAGKFDLTIGPVNTVQTLDEVQKLSATLLNPGVKLVAAYAPDLPRLQGDEMRIRQILVNLVGNACKFTRQGQITLDARCQDGQICFSIADTGPGIPPEAQSKLFRPFVQASQDIARRYGGTGMGLVISKRLVELHGGQIWFESATGQGTTFYFTMPVAPQAKTV